MGNHGAPLSRLEKNFDIASIFAALLVIPAVILQTSNEPYEKWGEALSVGIWVYFVVEVTVMLRIAPDNLKWLRGHIFESIVIVLSCPALIFMAEEGAGLAVAPLALLARLLKLLKFTKFVKLGKMAKSLKIVRDDGSVPFVISCLATSTVFLLVLGILGMIVDHEAHSFLAGIGFWVEGLGEFSGLDPFVLLISIGGIAAVISSIAHWSGKGSNELNDVDQI